MVTVHSRGQENKPIFHPLSNIRFSHFFLLIENENEMHLACDYLLLSSMIKVILESCVVPCIVWIFSFFFMVFFTLFYFCVKDRYILVFFLNPSFNGEKSVRTFYVWFFSSLLIEKWVKYSAHHFCFDKTLCMIWNEFTLTG